MLKVSCWAKYKERNSFVLALENTLNVPWRFTFLRFNINSIYTYFSLQLFSHSSDPPKLTPTEGKDNIGNGDARSARNDTVRQRLVRRAVSRQSDPFVELSEIIRYGFCDIRNTQGRGKCNRPRPILSCIIHCFKEITTNTPSHSLTLL